MLCCYCRRQHKVKCSPLSCFQSRSHSLVNSAHLLCGCLRVVQGEGADTGHSGLPTEQQRQEEADKFGNKGGLLAALAAGNAAMKEDADRGDTMFLEDEDDEEELVVDADRMGEGEAGGMFCFFGFCDVG